MNKDDMKHRTRQFALRVVRLVESLPKGRTGDVLGKQLLRSGTYKGGLKSSAFFVRGRLTGRIHQINKCVMVSAWHRRNVDSLRLIHNSWLMQKLSNLKN